VAAVLAIATAVLVVLLARADHGDGAARTDHPPPGTPLDAHSGEASRIDERFGVLSTARSSRCDLDAAA